MIDLTKNTLCYGDNLEVLRRVSGIAHYGASYRQIEVRRVTAQ